MLQRIVSLAAAMMLLTMSLCLAMTKSTLSESAFCSEISARKFAVFVKDGSSYTMYAPSSPSSAKSELRSALPSGRMEVYTSNIAMRDYLDACGWYDDMIPEYIGRSGMWHFTAWAKR